MLQSVIALSLLATLIVGCKSSEPEPVVCSDYSSFAPECADFQGGYERGYSEAYNGIGGYEDGYKEGYRDGYAGIGYDYFADEAPLCGRRPVLADSLEAESRGDRIVYTKGYDYGDGYALGSYRGCNKGYEEGYRTGLNDGERNQDW